MNSLYASKRISQVIWPDFTAHFKSETTKGSYRTDICEIMKYYEKDFLEIGKEDIQEYYKEMERRVKEGTISSSTMAKKFRELHSFAEYICENRERYGIRDSFQDEYYPYLKLVAKQEQYAHSVPVEHIDKLLTAAENDRMAYSILILLHRVGLSSTEITELRIEDFGIYDNGAYVQVVGRRQACYIPEDVVCILEKYINERQQNSYFFYNKRGRKLNVMYISRLMKKYTMLAEVPGYSAENIRNTCGVTMFAYGAGEKQVAEQMGITVAQIKRYRNRSYRDNLIKEANQLVKIRVLPPG